MARRIPSSWKINHTVLNYKKGDTSDPTNWRPISLLSTIYKIYMAVLAHRLAKFCISNKVLSPYQKGFLPFEGCFDHSFIMHSLFEDSKRRSRDLWVIWFDLQNAFGSIPHSIMFKIMARLGIPPAFITLCRDIYTDSKFSIRTSSGLSPPIRYLAYADDLCIFGNSKSDITSIISVFEEFLTWCRRPSSPLSVVRYLVLILFLGSMSSHSPHAYWVNRFVP